MPLKRISIVTAGSRGDVQPYLALALELRQRGYEIRFITNENFGSWLQSYGFGFCGMLPDSNQVLRDEPKLRQAMDDGKAATLFAGIASASAKMAPAAFERFRQELEDFPPDLIIKGPLVDFLVYYAVLKYKIPFVDIFWMFLTYNPEHALWGFPKLPFGLHRIFSFLILNGYYQGQKVYDLDPECKIAEQVSKSQFLETYYRPKLPKILMVSELIQPVLYPNVPKNIVKFVGYATVPDGDQANDAAFGGSEARQTLEKFLDESTTMDCIYMGWGSMSAGPQMSEFVVRTLQLSGTRGIVLQGNAGLGLQHVHNLELLDYAQEHVLFVPNAPHEWLFPRVALTVHHGGSGTTAAALRSGRPTIITPVFVDQWDHAYVVNQLGCGVGFESTQLQRSHSEDLARAIQDVLTNEKMQQRAREVGAKLKLEHGTVRAADELELYWTEFGETEKFHQLFPGERKPTSRFWTWFAIGVVAVATTGAVVAQHSWKRAR